MDTEKGAPMEQSFPRSVADEWDALRDAARLRHLPRPPRGELTEGELQDYLKSLGSEMRQARWRAGLTQEQVALMMDTTKSSVSARAYWPERSVGHYAVPLRQCDRLQTPDSPHAGMPGSRPAGVVDAGGSEYGR